MSGRFSGRPGRHHPSIIFFDEVDALVPRRGSYEGSSHVTESVVSQILTELDGLEELKNVTVIAATNRPDMIDPALLRPGRLERHIYVPPPDEEGRKKIFEVYLRDAGALLTEDISIDDLVRQTEGLCRRRYRGPGPPGKTWCNA